MRHIFIINPTAGKTSAVDSLRMQIHSLKTEDAVEIFVTRRAGEAKHIAEREASVGDKIRIYACGGDGTANEVLEGIAGHNNCAMGIIPIGSGNDFVKALEPYAKEDFLCLQNMIDGVEKTIDIMECGGRYSMNVFSVGFDAAVAKNVDKFKRLPFVSGSFAYKLSIVYCLFTKRKHKVKITIDGKPFEKADYKKTTLLAIGGNGQFYGGGFKAAPKAQLSDGYIDFVHSNTLSVLKFALMVGKYKKGEHINNPKLPFITFKRCKSIGFQAEAPIDINVDGEIYSMMNPVLKISEGALKLVLPKK
ncbi:MAG: diacylglycerol kinase family lipid kinase [Ruminococcaceae bacterium]|nr:diacylglycerol kinase family lipid kinase [Oscillospiraceae bacterium]